MADSDLKLNLKTLSSAEFIESFKAKVIKVSEGALSDFSESSTLSVLAEALAQMVSEELNTYLENIFPELLAKSWELFGFTRQAETFATGRARVLLSETLGSDFQLPRGYRFVVGDILFETTADLFVAAGVDTSIAANYPLATAPVIAVSAGEKANKPRSEGSILYTVPGLSKVYLSEATTGGHAIETPEAFRTRIALFLLTAVGDRPIVTPREYETEAALLLGAGSIAVAVPEINGESLAREVAAMTVFVRGASAAAPTISDIGKLQAEIAPRAPLSEGRLYFRELPISGVTIEANVQGDATRGSIEIADEINIALRKLVTPANTLADETLDIQRAVVAVYSVAGVDSATVLWAIAPDPVPEARRLLLPNLAVSTPRTGAAKVLSVVVNFPGGIQYTF